jgi:L-arabinokinase
LFLNPADHWAAYAAGVFPVLMTERNVSFARGARILVASQVPEGKGVASSAALEVAVMHAVASAFAIEMSPIELALLCQKVENFIAGAPCGVMDQMTSVFGETDSLMALLCQPAELQDPVRVPDQVAFWGIDSGERHAVAGSDYGSVRAGAFMGYRILSVEGQVDTGYLANVSPAKLEQDLLHRLPETMSGKEFLTRYAGTIDTVTAVDEERTYNIRQPAVHPIYEHHRVRTFRRLLLGPQSEEQWTLLGELMYQSHASYSASGLGSPGTSRIVELVRSAGPDAGLYGARITGGGCGGTVAVLGRSGAEKAIARIAEMYGKEKGYKPYIFSGTSEGAASFGTKTII